MEIRPVAGGDLAAVAAIARANGDHDGTDPRYVRHQAAHGRFLVAADETPGKGAPGGVAGYGAIRRIGDATMLCDLFVDPARQQAGTGKRLLEALLADAGERFTFASKDPRAMPLYARHGMAPRWPLLYLSGQPEAAAPGAGPARAQTVPAARAAAEELRLTGRDRAMDYAFWADAPGGGAIIVRDAAAIVAAGAVTAETTTTATTATVRHLATEPGRDPAAALAAVLALLAETAARATPTARATPATRAELCLPGPHPALRPLLDAGWRIEDYDHYMASRADLLSPSLVLSPSLALARSGVLQLAHASGTGVVDRQLHQD